MKGVVIAVITVLLVGLVLAEDWSGFEEEQTSSLATDNVGQTSTNTTIITEEIPVNNVQEQTTSTTAPVSSSDKNDYQIERKYTDNFYLAVWIGSGGALIMIIFLFLLFKKPKDRFKTKK